MKPSISLRAAVSVVAVVAAALTQAPSSAQTGNAPASPAPPKLAEFKRDLAVEIDAMKEFSQQMVDSVFSFGELGFQEVETSRYLTGILRQNGFRIEQPVA